MIDWLFLNKIRSKKFIFLRTEKNKFHCKKSCFKYTNGVLQKTTHSFGAKFCILIKGHSWLRYLILKYKKKNSDKIIWKWVRYSSVSVGENVILLLKFMYNVLYLYRKRIRICMLFVKCIGKGAWSSSPLAHNQSNGCLH